MFERELNQVALESGYQDAEARNLRSLGQRPTRLTWLGETTDMPQALSLRLDRQTLCYTAPREHRSQQRKHEGHCKNEPETGHGEHNATMRTGGNDPVPFLIKACFPMIWIFFDTPTMPVARSKFAGVRTKIARDRVHSVQYPGLQGNGHAECQTY